MRTVSYGEIAGSARVAAKGIGFQLDAIRAHSKERGWPWLNVIAVASGTWVPGDKVYGMPGLEGLSEVEQERLWRGMVLQVFAFDWRDADFR